MKLDFLSKTTKVILILTVLIALYSISCRLLSIFFFWESSFVAQWFIYTSIFLFLRDWRRAIKDKGKSTFFPKLLTGILIFLIFVSSTFAVALPFTQSYEVAIADLKKDMAVAYEVGEIQSIVYRCRGAIQISSDFQGTSGQAQVLVIVKGTKAYKDYDLSMVLSPQTGGWKVMHIE